MNIVLQFFIFNLIIIGRDFFIYLFKIVFVNLKGLFDGNGVSLTKKEYGSAVHFL